MNTFITTLVGYNERLVNKRDGSGQFTIHELTDANGIKWTVRRDVAQLAQGYLHQPVEIVTRTEQRGNFTNRYIDHLAPANGAVQPVLQAQAAQQTHAVYQPVTSPTPEPTYPEIVSDKERQTFIMRQTAAKVAADLSKTPDEFWRNCEDLLRYFQTGFKPDAFRFAEAATGQRVPEFVTAGDGPPPYGDEDIPF